MMTLSFLQQLESQMKMKEMQVNELETQASHLCRIEPDHVDEIEARRALVAERWGLRSHTLGFLKQKIQ